MDKKNCLIAYFSRAGDNYVDGSIVDLPVGNTEVVGRLIQKLAGGNAFRIETLREYPADYGEATKVAQQELRQEARPELSAHVENMDEYGTVFLGYPNWWGTAPMAVFTFLEEYDFAGKTILPFCTHEGSGMGRSESDIRRLCPGAEVLDGHPIKGGSVRRAEREIAAWLGKLGRLK